MIKSFSALLALSAFGLLFVTSCSKDDSASAGNEIGSSASQNGEPADSTELSSSSEEAVPCDTEGAFVWTEQGVRYSLCKDGFWQGHPVEPHESNGFDECQFNFGAAWQTAHEKEEFYRGLDYIAVWLGDNAFYNAFEKRMVKMCLKVNATPMIYAYVIAEFGKDQGLVDCDMSDAEHPKSLCSDGSELMRTYFADSILYRYKKYAEGMQSQLELLEVDPTTFKSIWLIEPDFYQYSESASKQKFYYDSTGQVGGGIPDSLMGVYFKQIVETIRTYLPAAKVAVDISPWISDRDTAAQREWYSNFDMDEIDYLSTSGGRTSAMSEYVRTGNKAKWRALYELTGKPILADAGYDAGGQGTGHAVAWDKSFNILPRMADGVLGVMQMDAEYGYPALADTVRPQLNYQYPWCTEKK